MRTGGISEKAFEKIWRSAWKVLGNLKIKVEDKINYRNYTVNGNIGRMFLCLCACVCVCIWMCASTLVHIWRYLRVWMWVSARGFMLRPSVRLGTGFFSFIFICFFFVSKFLFHFNYLKLIVRHWCVTKHRSVTYTSHSFLNIPSEVPTGLYNPS